MKYTKCKRCNTENLYWTQGNNGKWVLNDNDGKQHRCDIFQEVSCKFCNATGLHWSDEEVNPITKEKSKPMLMENYGLPHGCDEKRIFIEKQKADKKSEYETEKKRILAHADGKCPPCNGTGNNLVTPNGYGLCTNCHGQSRFDARTKKYMLAGLRQKIWPNMPPTTFGRRY